MLMAAFLLFSCNNSADTAFTPDTSSMDAAVVKKPDGTAVENPPVPQSAAITVEHPLPNAEVRSPLQVKGKARGTWFFEGSFPVILYDANRVPLAQGSAMAQGNWMTEEFVPFSLTLSFTIPQSRTGTLVLEKDNPSGLQQNADSVIIPVLFSAK